MKLVSATHNGNKSVEVYEVDNYQFEFWVENGKYQGPKIGNVYVNCVDEDRLFNAAKKIYPNVSRKIRFTSLETELL